MAKREANFGRLFRHWIKAHPRPSAAFELKETNSNRLPFREIQEHQLDALMAVKHGELLYKIPDDSRGVKPFDMMYFAGVEAYLVIKYPEFFCLIDIDDLNAEIEWSDEKSLTTERAREIASTVVDL